jgi:fucokinase
MEDADSLDLGLKIRIYYAISGYMKHNGDSFDGKKYDYAEDLCFRTIQDTIYRSVTSRLPDSSAYNIVKDRVDVKLPVRVNWGGGWTDTPPYCMEKGGVVLNAAISLNGILPVQITVKKLDEYHVEFESQDVGVYGTVTKLEELQDCHNPYDPFALHKAALIACGLIPLEGGKETLEEILHRIGGGLYLSTSVVGVPKGSGLGTSSILAGGCVRGLFEFFGQERSNEEIYGVVLSMEQIMSTGGGWQDQVGGLTNGVKLIRTNPGMKQNMQVEHVKMSEAAANELQERFALIYTGQRRLARNLLRKVVGGYIGSRPESVTALKEMKPKAAMMKFYLEQGDIDSFAEELNRHWDLSCMLDSGTTNTCIDQIFAACEHLIDGKFISGAGGGGFLMVILKKGVTKQMLHERLEEIFQDSGVGVWETAFV